MNTSINEIAKSDINSIARWLADETGASAVILFGSQARGQATPNSDTDLCLIIPEDIDHNQIDRFGLAQEIRKAGGPALDIIVARPDALFNERDSINNLAFDIAREGKLLFGQADGLFKDHAA